MVVHPKRSSTGLLRRKRTTAVPAEGYVLLTTLFALLLLATAAALVFSMVISEQIQQRRHHQHMQLQAMNDALIAETLAELSHHRSFSGVAPRSVGSGSGESTVTEITASRSHIRTTVSLGGKSLATGTMINVSTTVPRVLSWQRLQISPAKR